MSRWSASLEDTRWYQKMAQMLGGGCRKQLKNTVAGGDYCGSGGHGGYGLVASREMVMVIPMRWLEEDLGLASG